mmetsp:Transcript_17702/g.15087  ORF Transcript_17702/g.15087 Transcript_17702/m.15087 type:complete len:175 (-) Transcript_17702:45-569(-)
MSRRGRHERLMSTWIRGKALTIRSTWTTPSDRRLAVGYTNTDLPLRELITIIIHPSVYWKVYPAIVPHPVTGERCWFNQIHAQHKSFYYSHPKFRDMPRDSNRYPVNTTYGDGTEIEPEVLSHIRSIIWRNCHAAPLHTGALLVQDNYLTLHGRMDYDGHKFPKREVSVSVTYS